MARTAKANRPRPIVVRSRRAERHGRRSARLLSLAGLFSIGFWVWLVALHHGGAGPWLGLSLVNAIARHHGGQLILADNAPGLRVLLELPKTESPAEGSHG